MNIPYEPIRPVLAVWSLEFAEATAVIFIQEADKETHIIGSRLWRFVALSDCFKDLADWPWRRRITNHIIPPSSDVWADLFDAAKLPVEVAPGHINDAQLVTLTRELFPVLKIDQEQRPWSGDEPNNGELIQSINGYRAELSRHSETFTRNPIHSWERYLVRCIELYALWKHEGGGTAFHQRPNYDRYNRTVI